MHTEEAELILEDMNQEQIGEWLVQKGFHEDIVSAFAGNFA